ncbi:MAG: MFS transporter [Sphingobium sp.]
MRILGRAKHFHYGAGIAAAALACLQPGIDPVFLTLLSSAHGIAPADHGWIVGATQSGMALGSLLVMRLGSRMRPRLAPMAALLALISGVATAQVEDTRMLLPLRGGYGLAMGIVYTQAMSKTAGLRPHNAYAAVFLLQLLLSTLVALILPAIAAASDPAMALLAHALVPLAALAALLSSAGAAARKPDAAKPSSRPHLPLPDSTAWALAAASLSFICATMMVWSFTGALAAAAHFSEMALGRAVAAGSVAGALTALFVMRERAVVPLPLTGLLSGLSLLAPMAAIPTGRDSALLLSVILLNIGSTAIIIRCSGTAAARSPDPHFQRVVAFTHSGGMILGPAIGSLLMRGFGVAGLKGGMMAALTAGCGALLLSRRRQARQADGTHGGEAEGTECRGPHSG